MCEYGRRWTIEFMTNSKPARMRVDEISPGRARGGDLRILLGPGTVGSRSGYMGTATLQPGERVVEHFHPYSEEFLYCARGDLVLDVEGSESSLTAGEGIYVPIGVRHRLRNVGGDEAMCVFHLGPLAPDPALSHIDTEIVSGSQAGASSERAAPARILFTVTVADGKEADFLAAYEKVRYSVMKTPGHIRDQICQASDDPQRWLITSEWTSLTEFFAWEKSEEHKEMVRPMRECYTATEFRSFSVVSETGLKLP